MSEYLGNQVVDLSWSDLNSQDFVKPTSGKLNSYSIPLRTCIFESQNFKHISTQIVDLAAATFETGTS